MKISPMMLALGAAAAILLGKKKKIGLSPAEEIKAQQAAEDVFDSAINQGDSVEKARNRAAYTYRTGFGGSDLSFLNEIKTWMAQ